MPQANDKASDRPREAWARGAWCLFNFPVCVCIIKKKKKTRRASPLRHVGRHMTMPQWGRWFPGIRPALLGSPWGPQHRALTTCLPLSRTVRKRLCQTSLQAGFQPNTYSQYPIPTPLASLPPVKVYTLLSIFFRPPMVSDHSRGMSSAVLDKKALHTAPLKVEGR